MKIIFMGTPDFAIPSLKTLVETNHELVLVVTGPDKPRGRGQRMCPTPIKKEAQKYDLPVYQPETLRSPDVVESLQSYAADLYVVVAFRILPEEIIALPHKGVVNLHASLLPKYRGAAPIQWAILNGERETGVTTFFIEKKVDTGDIILQESVPIHQSDTAGDLHDRLAQVGAKVLRQTVELIHQGNPPRRKQEGTTTKAPKITRRMCQIDWDSSTEKVINQIRAFSPYPGAFTYLNGKLLKICRAQPSDIRDQKDPGTIRVENNRIFASTGDGWIELLQVQEECKRRLDTSHYLSGKSTEDLVRFEKVE